MGLEELWYEPIHYDGTIKAGLFPASNLHSFSSPHRNSSPHPNTEPYHPNRNKNGYFYTNHDPNSNEYTYANK
jgi:hypothetical protein